MSKFEKYFARGGKSETPDFPCGPASALRTAVCLDGDAVEGGIFGCVQWIVAEIEGEGLVAHDSDELHMFVGGDARDHENLNAEIDFQIENDHLVFSETSFVFVPAGCAHNIVSVRNVEKPFLHYIMHVNAGFYKARSAEASAAAGKYANNRVVRYERPDGILPKAPEGFLTRLLWIDGAKLEGAPYTESVWFHTTNDTGPKNHVHDNLDEFVAFIGSDPEDPENLNGCISLDIGDERIFTEKSTIVFIPRGIAHSPLLVHELKKDILHFSGGNSGDYKRA
ncbi:MAG: hypothetical protein IJY96_00015 [Oscillospiraceae bacterium]|nr:hypothetical protein [Oscillospiraceae bacterium]